MKTTADIHQSPTAEPTLSSVTRHGYRPEIDGLRTVAIAAVVLYHLDKEWLVGGFLGVDVFFVLSGYLISSLVYRDVACGSFSLIGFWKRRLRRLYPAAAVMIASVLCVGSILLIRPERTALPKQAIAALFSFENMYLWKTTGGYWDSSSEDISLLHTWSLSLEEQFYVLLPLTLLIVHRYARGRELVVLGLLLGLSLIACHWVTRFDRSAAFYFLPTRMWELLIGSLLAIMAVNGKLRVDGRWGMIGSCLGLSMILLAFSTIRNDQGFPGLYPLLPCLGTALLLPTETRLNPVKRFLSAGPMVYFGKLSYSLYLWHWPVIVFLKYTGMPFNPLLAVGLSIGLAVLSYHAIENPFRFGKLSSRRGYLALAGYVSAGMILAVSIPRSPLIANLGNIDSNESLARGWEFEGLNAVKSGKAGVEFGRRSGPVDICVLGSSHARMFCPPIAEFAESEQLRAISMAISGVGIMAEGATPGGLDRTRLNRERERMIQEVKPRVLVLAGVWNHEFKALPNAATSKFIDKLTEYSRNADHVIVVGQIPSILLPKPFQGSFRKYLVAQSLAGGKISVPYDPDEPLANHEIELLVKKSELANVSFVNPHTSLIAERGQVKILENNQFLYSDEIHVNVAGAKKIFDNLLRPAILEALKR